MKADGGWIVCGILFFCASLIPVFLPFGVMGAEEYSFEVEDFEPQLFEWGGYAEAKFEHMELNTDSTFYPFNFHQDPRATINRYTGTLQLEGHYKKGIAVFNGKLQAECMSDDMDGSERADVYEANLSLKPTPFVTVDIGKKVFRWGKGYAWNPVGFIDRVKDPGNPEEALEGYYGAGFDWIKSLDGSLKTVALTSVVLPVWRDVNDDFGERNHVNFAAKLYMLYRNVDMDLVFFSGDSRSRRYGIDFSKNLAENFEIHGEFAYFTNLNKKNLSETGTLTQEEYSKNKYLLGLRYLTESDITTIIEYYYNGIGFSESELKGFYRFFADANTQWLDSITDAFSPKVQNLSVMGNESPGAGRHYLYLKINQKDPFDLLYFTPSVIAIVNLDDQSCSITPEVLYTGFTNFEIRLRYTMSGGDKWTEFQEKQNKNKFEFRVRYFF
jgi:hypothetical protein